MMRCDCALRYPAILWVVMMICGCQITPRPEEKSALNVYQPRHTISFPSERTLVLVGGCFDVLHYGHMQFLEKARKAGGTNSYLIVALEPDHRIIHSKKRPPFHTQNQRAHNLASIRYVDHVMLLGSLKTDQDYDQLVQDIRPDIIAITSDDPQIDNKKKQVQRVGGILSIVMDRISPFASSRMIQTPHNHQNNIRPSYTNLVHEGLHKARQLNCPTANIAIHAPLPQPGVYSCLIKLGNQMHKGMCYYDNKRPETLEAHIFDYNQNIYGKEITVFLHTMIRAPLHFDSLDALRQRIQEDAVLCRNDPALKTE